MGRADHRSDRGAGRVLAGTHPAGESGRATAPPQAKAIQVLCLLSLAFGGLLWPLAWLWAYSKPVLYKMAYGTDVGDEHHGESAEAPETVASPEATREEIEQLRARLATLEAKLGREARG